MIASVFATASRLVCGAAVDWHCTPRGARQRIYFANHSSHLDFIVIWSALPADLRRLARPVAGRDYWEQGTLRRYLAAEVFHAVLIQRSKAGSIEPAAVARASVEHMAAEMGDRHSLIVFPEGTRGSHREIGHFKSGLYHLSRLRPDVELIPVYLENLNRILPKGEVLPVPMLSRVVFGSPLTANTSEDKPAFLAKARQALIELKGSDEPLR